MPVFRASRSTQRLSATARSRAPRHGRQPVQTRLVPVRYSAGRATYAGTSRGRGHAPRRGVLPSRRTRSAGLARSAGYGAARICITAERMAQTRAFQDAAYRRGQHRVGLLAVLWKHEYSGPLVMQAYEIGGDPYRSADRSITYVRAIAERFRRNPLLNPYHEGTTG